MVDPMTTRRGPGIHNQGTWFFTPTTYLTVLWLWLPDSHLRRAAGWRYATRIG